MIYYYFPSDRQIWLMTLYDKDEVSDLSPKQKETLRDSVAAELAQRAAKRAIRGRP